MTSGSPHGRSASVAPPEGDNVGFVHGAGLTGGDRCRGMTDTIATQHQPSDASILARLRAGDEAAFVELVDLHHGSLWRVARMYTTEAVADEVVQETWIAVLHGLERFEGRASLRTWIIGI